jgi:hypothetical protein
MTDLLMRLNRWKVRGCIVVQFKEPQLPIKSIFFSLSWFLSSSLAALEYAVLFENEQISIDKAKIMSKEESQLHRDNYPHIVIALKGGSLTRLESNGTETVVNFPTGAAVIRPVDPPDELHKTVNRSAEPIELIIIQLKSIDQNQIEGCTQKKK